MTVVEALHLLGGIADRGHLIALTSRAEVDRALRETAVVAVARGRYGLPDTESALLAAHRVGGAVSHLSAALHHGWPVKTVPDRAQVTVPRRRRLSTARRREVQLFWADLDSDDVADGVTTVDRTLVDCLRVLPFDEALAVADSALRCGYSHRRLVALTGRARGPGSARARRVAAAADERAANPFESVLRAACLQLGLDVRPQVPIFGEDFLARPDLVSEELRLVLEADSFAWHGDRHALDRDARRYNELVTHGWLVLRFSWEEVMLRPHRVEEILRRVVEVRTQRPPGCRCHA